jgi:hypothetical protein
VSDIVELTLALAGAQDTVTHYNVTRQTGLIEDAKRERDDARTAIHDAFHGRDALIADLLAALESIENDDGRIPQAIWDMRNAAIAKARGL